MGELMIQVQVIYTALMAGIMLMYTITLGRYFGYILKHNIPGASQNWALFRNNTRVQIHHTAVLVGHAIVSIVSHAYYSYGNWLCQGRIFCQWCAAIG